MLGRWVLDLVEGTVALFSLVVEHFGRSAGAYAARASDSARFAADLGRTGLLFALGTHTFQQTVVEDHACGAAGKGVSLVVAK